MIPGITASGALKSASAPAQFKGVATLTSGVVEVFQDNQDGTYPRVFSISGGTGIELAANDLLIYRNGYPYLSVYSWNGSTFALTWEMKPTLHGNLPVSSASISKDGNRIVYTGYNGNNPIATLVRQGDGSYVEEALISNSGGGESIATNGDGTFAFINRGSNTMASMVQYTGGSWSAASGTGSAPYGYGQPSACSRDGDMIYAATLSTSSPYICFYRMVMSTGSKSRLSNSSAAWPSTWKPQCIEVSDDGAFVAAGYFGSNPHGGIRIYSQSSATTFNNVAFDSGTQSYGRVNGLTFNGDGTKLFGGRYSTASDHIWIWERNGSVWTQKGAITTNAAFTTSDLSHRVISAN